jgi:hypothetical protein
MKKYTFQITIDEGYDEWWEAINNNESTGCNELLEELKEVMHFSGFYGADVKLIEYKDE